MVKVSAVMPTRGRREYAQQALDCYCRQTYPNRELVILDDQDDPSFPGGVSGEGIRHQWMLTKLNIGEKRNLCCRLANGEIIWHLDSDDWSAPERMEQQVRLLHRSSYPLVGYSSCLWWDEKEQQAWQYRGWPNPNTYAVGTSLCFLKSWWKTNQFTDKPIGSDNDLVRKAHGRMLSVDAGKMLVARNHAGSSNKRKLEEDEFWVKVPTGALPEAFLNLIKVAA